MELRSTFTFTFFFLLLLLLAFPHISRGRSEGEDSEIYEIDYRGPETHSSAMPPPGRSHGRPFINTENASRVAANGHNAKKIHG